MPIAGVVAIIAEKLKEHVGKNAKYEFHLKSFTVSTYSDVYSSLLTRTMFIESVSNLIFCLFL